MDMMLKRLLTLGLLLPAIAQAVPPENGMYVESTLGNGFYVEVQGSTAVLVAYTYDDETEQPLFYYSSGTITEGARVISPIFTPNFPMPNDYQHELRGVLYRFDNGPCLTCTATGWDTAQHAVASGDIHMRLAGLGEARWTVTNWPSNWLPSPVRRHRFGLLGFDLQSASGASAPDFTSIRSLYALPDLGGTWVFSDLDRTDAPQWIANFSKRKGPYAEDHDVFRADTGEWSYKPGDPIVDFIDPDSDATLSCFVMGCRFTAEGQDRILIRNDDIGINRVLGYRSPVDDEASRSMVLESGVYYRGDDLVRAVRIADPIPDAPPAPEGN